MTPGRPKASRDDNKGSYDLGGETYSPIAPNWNQKQRNTEKK